MNKNKLTLAGAGLMIAMLVMTAAPSAFALNYYWDTNSTSAGFGAASGTWGTSNFWNTDSTGGSGGAFSTAITSSDTGFFGSDTIGNGLASGTVGVTGAVSTGNIYFGSQSGSITLSGGTSLTLAATSIITVNNTSDTISTPLLGAGTSLEISNGAITIGGSNTFVPASLIIDSGATYNWGSSGSVTIAGAITGAGTLAMSGSGTLTLSSATSSYSGGTVINSGKVVAGATTTALGTGTITFTGSAQLQPYSGGVTGTFKYPQDVALANGATASLGGNGQFWFSGNVTGNGGITASTFSFGSVVFLNGTNNTFTGPIIIGPGGTGATWWNVSVASLADSATANGAIQLASGSTYTSSGRSDGFIWTGASNLVLNNRQLVVASTTIPGGSFYNNSTNNSTITINTTVTGALGSFAAGARILSLGGSSTGANTIAGAIVDGTSVTLAPTITAGTWIFSGTNTYSGPTTISAGKLQISGSGSLGSGNYSNTIANSTTLQFSSSANQTFAGAISGAGVLTKDTGTGTLTLSGANTYSGATTVNAGTLQLNSTAALGGFASVTAGVSSTFSSVTVTPSGTGITQATLELNGTTISTATTLNGTATGGNSASLINSNTGTTAILDSGVLGLTFTSSTGTAWHLASLTTSPLTVSGGGATTAATANVTNLATTTSTFTASGGTGWVTGNTLTVSGGGSTTSAVYNVTATSGAITGLTQTTAGIGFTTLSGLTYTGAKGTQTTFSGAGGSFAGVDGNFTLNSIALVSNGSGYTGTGTISSTDGGGTLTATTRATLPSLTLVGTNNQLGGNGNLIINSVISGASGGFSKIGSGTLTLTGTNTYSGATIINAGDVRGNGTLTNSDVSVTSTSASLWPGTAISGSGVGPIETLTVKTVNLTAGKLKIAFNASNTQKLAVTGNANIAGGTLSLGITTNLGSGSATILTSSSITGTFSTVIVNNTTYTSANSFLNMPVSVNYDTPISGSITVVINSAVTPVKITDFAAKSEGSGVNVSWTAVSEYQNAGFHIYRRALESAEWTKVNPTLIAGRITNPDERKYTYFDWASSGMYEYKLESIDVSGGREAYAKLSDVVDVDWAAELTPSNDVSSVVVDSAVRSIDMDFSAQTAQRVETLFAAARTDDVNAAPKVAVRELSARSTNDMAVVNNVAVRSAASAAQVQTPSVGIRWFSSGRIGTTSNYTTAKVMYKNAGVMVIPQSSMPDGFDLGNVALQREGRNLNALAKVPAGLLVYAPGYKDNYTDKDAIFIRKSTNATNAGSPTVATGLFSSASPLNVTSSNTVTNDYHDVYFDYNLRPFSFEPWFSSKYLTQGSSQDFNVALTDVVSGSATMVVNLWSLTSSDSVNPDHGIQVLVNGQAIGESSWDGGNKMVQLSFTVPAGSLKTGDNVVSLVTPNIAGQDSQISFLHSISVSYTRGLEASKPVEITSMGGMYELYNIPATGAWVVDARFSDRASLVPTETQAQADGTLRLRFVAQSGGSGKYIVVPSGQENTPLSVNARMVKAMKLNGIYLATGPAQFASGTQALLMKRAKEGIRGAYVDQEQLFDYYNYGRFGPDGIRNAVRSTKPTYLLLVGRTTYDYLNYEGQSIDPLCPAYLVSTNFWAQTTSDSAFGDLGRGYPEVAVGRLPVNNTTELSGAISHIVNYKGIPQSGIRLHAVADKPDPLVADFGAQLDSAIKVNNPDITWQENYLEKTYATAPEVTAALKDAANGGADLIVYSGHGNAARLGAADPRILDQTSVQEWTGNTVFLQSTCTANWMAKNVNDYKSIAIQALTQSQGGISASIGTSTYMNSDVATAFMNQLLKNGTVSGARWGSVLMKTQVWAGNQGGSAFNKDLMTTEQLFGDPAMPVYTKSAASTPSASSNAAGTF